LSPTIIKMIDVFELGDVLINVLNKYPCEECGLVLKVVRTERVNNFVWNVYTTCPNCFDNDEHKLFQIQRLQ
jgi:hypothetical protein